MLKTIARLLIFFTVVGVLLLLTPNSVKAQRVVGDDFSSNLDKWQVVAGPTSTWKVEDGVLKGKITSYFTQSMITLRDNYWLSAPNTYQVDFDIKPIKGTDKNILFAYKSPTDWYEFHLSGAENEVIKVKDGKTVWSKKTALNDLSSGEWHHITLKLGNGQIRIQKDDIEVFNFIDLDYDGTYYRPGFRVTTGADAPTEIHFDNFVVTSLSLSELDLPVPLFKQTDPIWGYKLYDTANLWASNPSIASWGCAVTSAAMILQYHGFVTMPDGKVLNPDTLNEWLKSQPDGYIGQGLVNWFAITRLAKSISNKTGQYALEYKKHTVDKSAIKGEVQNLKPVILEIPGHFIVGKGTTGNNDFNINDPAYNYNYLSEHESRGKYLVSYRTFTPSHTDLSSLLIVHKENTSVSIFIDGQLQPAVSTLEFIESYGEVDAESSVSVVLTELAKPMGSSFTIHIEGELYSNSQVELYYYDTNGEVSSASLETLHGPNPSIINVEVEVDQLHLHPLYNFEELKNDLYEFRQANQLYYWWLYYQLIEIIDYAIEAGSSGAGNNGGGEGGVGDGEAGNGDRLRYTALLKQMVADHDQGFSDEALNYLLNRLDILG